VTATIGRPAVGLALHPFRALRPTAGEDRLGRLLCPPYDVISEQQRTELLALDPDNAVSVVLPQVPGASASVPTIAGEAVPDPYREAAARLDRWVADGTYRPDDDRALYVYEMSTADGGVTRGLLGAVELRDPADGVILPHENTMAGPVADRLALLEATGTNVEPIYLIYDGGGPASAAVHAADQSPVLARAVTPDGITHRLWAITDPQTHREIADDLAERRALIADGHHRYATYRELQRVMAAEHGPGPWDRGLTLLVDSSSYGPQVHAIHRVLLGLPLPDAQARVAGAADLTEVSDPATGLSAADRIVGFAAVLTDGHRTVVLTDTRGALRAAAGDRSDALADLDVSVLQRALVEGLWGRTDTVDQVGYAHSVDEAVQLAEESGGTAVLLRPTPVAAVAAVAAAGGRMPRKSTLFTPKPASGLVMRRFADES
jgi:uncharacterized protein (DUF1015 family)